MQAVFNPPMASDRLGLRSHCINGDHTAREGQLLEQKGNSGNLIGCFLRRQLREDQAIFRCPCAHEVKCFLAVGFIMGAAKCFPINSNDSFDARRDPLDPLEETGLTLFGIKQP